MILLRWSTSYVEIILWRQQTYDWATLKCIIIIIIFKIINKSYFLCIHDVTGCGYRPSHRHTFIITFMNFPRFIFSEFGPWRSSCGPVSDSPLSHAWKWRTQVGKRITGIPCVNVFRTLSLFPVWTIEENKVIELNRGPDIIITVYRIIIVFRR